MKIVFLLNVWYLSASQMRLTIPRIFLSVFISQFARSFFKLKLFITHCFENKWKTQHRHWSLFGKTIFGRMHKTFSLCIRYFLTFTKNSISRLARDLSSVSALEYMSYQVSSYLLLNIAVMSCIAYNKFLLKKLRCKNATFARRTTFFCHISHCNCWENLFRDFVYYQLTTPFIFIWCFAFEVNSGHMA